jgi:hypothetical protein
LEETQSTAGIAAFGIEPDRADLTAEAISQNTSKNHVDI